MLGFLSVIAFASLAPTVVGAQPATTTRVSVGPSGVQANGDSGEHTAAIPYGSGEHGVAISSDGRWVAFQSLASNLVVGDTNDQEDVFVHDRQTGATTRVSVSSAGAELDNTSARPVISANGRWVAMDSMASNAVGGDTNGVSDVFVRDLEQGTTTRVSIGPGGSQGNGGSFGASISADGRWVAFTSAASNLVTLDTNGAWDAFVHDRQTGTSARVSVGSDGSQGNSGAETVVISADGRWVAFHSYSSNLVPDDSNNRADVFVHDRQSGTTTRVSVSSAGVQANDDSRGPAISADGRWLAFTSQATNLVSGDTNNTWDVFVHDRQTGTTTRASVGPGGLQANAHSDLPTISADGRRVSFASPASNLVPGDTNGAYDVFAHDLSSGTTTRLSVGNGGAQGDGLSHGPWVSADATSVAFWSAASNLVAGDTNGYADVFVHDLGADEAPTGLVAHSIAGNLVTLRWTIPPGGVLPTGFVLEGGLNPGEVAASIPTGSTNPTFTFVAPTGSFYVRVHALNGAVRSAASNEIRIHVNVAVPPSAPAGLLGLVDGSNLALAWANTYEGGAPTSLVLDVTGPIATSLPLGSIDRFSFAGVPPGTYTLALRAQNAGGSSPPSTAVTLAFPGPCTGPPLTPANLLAYRVGSTVFVDWAPASSGPAPTSYVLHVTGTLVGDFATPGRALSGTVASGTYTLSVEAVNACGVSGSTAPQTVVVP